MIDWALTSEELDAIDPRNLVLVVFDTNGALRYIRGDALPNMARAADGVHTLTDLLANVVEVYNRRGASVNILAADCMGHLYPLGVQGLFVSGELEMVSTEPPLAKAEDGKVLDIPDLDTLARMLCAHLDTLGATGYHLQYDPSERCYATELDTPPGS
jgi:hypothetical protein